MSKAYQSALKQIKRLTPKELERLHAQIERRLQTIAIAEAKARQQTKRAARKASGRAADQKAKGWEEEKYITVKGKEYGPYKYRRWWDGGVLRSKYLGKAEPTKKASHKSA